MWTGQHHEKRLRISFSDAEKEEEGDNHEPAGGHRRPCLKVAPAVRHRWANIAHFQPSRGIRRLVNLKSSAYERGSYSDLFHTGGTQAASTRINNAPLAPYLAGLLSASLRTTVSQRSRSTCLPVARLVTNRGYHSRPRAQTWPQTPTVFAELPTNQIRDGEVELDDSAFGRAVLNSTVATRLSQELQQLEASPVPWVESTKVTSAALVL